MYPTDIEIKEAIKYLNMICDGIDIKEIATSHKTFDKFIDNLVKKNISFGYGASKIVFFDALDNWVIKINRPTYKTEDFCYLEAYNYEEACKCHLEKFFAETYCIAGYKFNNTTIILQRKANTIKGKEVTFQIFFDMVSDSYIPWSEDEDSEARFDHISEETSDLDDTERIIGVFGEEMELIDFIIEYDINDLHEGNFGFVDGNLVMTDFSGF